MAEAICEEYKSSLADLTFNSKPHINMLTMLAEENAQFAPQIVQVIESHLHKAKSSEKLPVLYLLDSVIKNVRESSYPALFTQNIVSTFCAVFEKVDERTRQQLFKLRQTWNDIFPQKKLYAIDLRVNQMDPAWPITSFPHQAIHVNPKFLSKTSEIEPLCQSVKEKQEAEMRQQLIAKQQELLRLQQQKLEMELLETKKKLEEQSKQLQSREKGNLLQVSEPSLVPLLPKQPESLVPESSVKQPPQSSFNIPVLNSRDPRLTTRDPRLRNLRMSHLGTSGELVPENITSSLNNHISLQTVNFKTDEQIIFPQENKIKSEIGSVATIVAKKEAKIFKGKSNISVESHNAFNKSKKDVVSHKNFENVHLLNIKHEDKTDSKVTIKELKVSQENKNNQANNNKEFQSTRLIKLDKFDNKHINNKHSSKDQLSKERFLKVDKGDKEYMKDSLKKEKVPKDRSLSLDYKDSDFKQRASRNNTQRKPTDKKSRGSRREERSRSRSPVDSKRSRSKNRIRSTSQDKLKDESIEKVIKTEEVMQDIDERINLVINTPKIKSNHINEDLSDDDSEKTSPRKVKFSRKSFDNTSDNEEPDNKKIKMDEFEEKGLFGSGKDQDYRQLPSRSPAQSKWALFKANHPETFSFSPRNSEDAESSPFGFGLQDQDMRVGLPIPDEQDENKEPFSNQEMSRNSRIENSYALRNQWVSFHDINKTEREIKDRMMVNRLSHKFEHRQLPSHDSNINHGTFTLKHKEEILQQAEHQLLAGEITHEQHQELLKQLHQLNQIQRLQHKTEEQKHDIREFTSNEFSDFKSQLNNRNDKSNFLREANREFPFKPHHKIETFQSSMEPQRPENILGTNKGRTLDEMPFGEKNYVNERRAPNNFQNVLDISMDSHNERIKQKDLTEVSRDLRRNSPSKVNEDWRTNSCSPDPVLRQYNNKRTISDTVKESNSPNNSFSGHSNKKTLLQIRDIQGSGPSPIQIQNTHSHALLKPSFLPVDPKGLHHEVPNLRNVGPGQEPQTSFGISALENRNPGESATREMELERRSWIETSEKRPCRERSAENCDGRNQPSVLNIPSIPEMKLANDGFIDSQMEVRNFSKRMELNRLPGNLSEVHGLRETLNENCQNFRGTSVDVQLPNNLCKEVPRFYNPRMVDIRAPRSQFPRNQNPRPMEPRFRGSMPGLLPPPLPPLPPPLPPVGRLRFSTENKKLKLLPQPPPLIRTILIDNEPQEIRFHLDIGFIIRDGKAYDVKFYGPVRNVIINGNSFPLMFGDCREIFIDGKPFLIKFGGPSRELIINGISFELRFGAPPVDIMLNGKVYEIELPGAPPEVRISDRPREDLNVEAILNGQSIDVTNNLFNSRQQHAPILPKSEVMSFENVPLNSNSQADKPCQKENKVSDHHENENLKPPANLMPVVLNPDSNPNSTLEMGQKLNLNENARLPSNNMKNIPVLNIPQGLDLNFNAGLNNVNPGLPVNPINLNTNSINKGINYTPSANVSILNSSLPNINLNPGTPLTSGPAINLNPLTTVGPSNILPAVVTTSSQGPLNLNSLPAVGPGNVMPGVITNVQQAPALNLIPLTTLGPVNVMSGAITTNAPLNFNPAIPPPPTTRSLFNHPPPTHLLPRPPVAHLSQSSGPTYPTMPNFSLPTTTSNSSLTSTSSHSSPINVNELVEKLFKAGMLVRLETNNSSKMSALTKMDTATNKENEAENAKFAVPEINFVPDELKVYHPDVIRRLYTGIQCQSCGVRFTAESIDRYAKHLDWHFRMNRREKDGAKKAFSRKWYYDMEGWIQFEEIEDLDEKARTNFFEMQAHEEASYIANQPAESISCPIANDSDKDNICAMCGEQFEPFWVEEEEAWHLKDAIRVDKLIYHPVCYEDAKEVSFMDSDGVQSPVEYATTLSLDKKTENEDKCNISNETVNQPNISNIEEATASKMVVEENINGVSNDEKETVVKQEVLPRVDCHIKSDTSTVSVGEIKIENSISDISKTPVAVVKNEKFIDSCSISNKNMTSVTKNEILISECSTVIKTENTISNIATSDVKNDNTDCSLRNETSNSITPESVKNENSISGISEANSENEKSVSSTNESSTKIETSLSNEFESTAKSENVNNENVVSDSCENSAIAEAKSIFTIPVIVKCDHRVFNIKKENLITASSHSKTTDTDKEESMET